ncbi:MAG TPA: hypothetical protein VHE30_00200 [Polyangiaceae bacterium]|nr:hypothetical protein [Polyangiaceae bacterium]
MAEPKPPRGSEIPDLDLRSPGGTPSRAPTPRVSAAPAPRTVAPAIPPKPPSGSLGAEDYFGSGNFDEDHFGGGGAGPSLDTEERPRTSGTRDLDFGAGPSLPTGGTVDLATGGEDLDLYEKSTAQAAVAVGRAVDRRAWPTGTTPDSASLRIDGAEVKLAAAFGEPPALSFLAPVYTFGVLVRRRALKAKIGELGEALEEATRARDEILVRLVQERRGKILMTDQGEALFEPIIAIERIALERRSALSGTNEEYERIATSLAAELQNIEGEADRQTQVVEERRASLAEVTRALERQEAKKKRLYIELTGIVALGEKSGGALQPAQKARAEELERLIAEHQPEVDRARDAVEASQKVLASAEGALHAIENRGREVARKKKREETALQAQIGARSEGVREAEKERLEAFVGVARRILAEKGRLVDVDSDTLASLQRADELVAKRATELEKHVRAFDAHDDPAYKRGFAIAGGGLALIVALVVFLATR